MEKSIICFIASLASGGAEHQMVILADLLAERGYDVTLTTFGDSPDHYTCSSKVRRVKLAQGKSTWRKVLAIFSYFLTVKTNVVISFAQRSNFLCLIPLLFRRGIKVIASERNFTMGEPDMKENALFALLYKRAAYIVPNSHTQGKYICDKKPTLASKIVPIINYTDIELFRPSHLPLNDVLKIAVFARYERQKNCHRFAEVLSALKNGGGRRFVIDWYGNHSFSNPTLSEYFDTLQQRIEEFGINDVWRINNPVKNVSEVMKQYDVICLPSLYEGFSNSVAEGIAAGRPMIVSDVSDSSLMVHHGENGFLFNPHDVGDMISAFRSLLTLSNDELRQMGKKSREIAEALFDKDRFVDSYVRLVEH